MPAVYNSKAPLTQVAPDALVIHCSAARYQPHFAEFLAEGLKLEDYSLIAVPGGIQVLVLLDYLPKFSWAAWRWTKFLVDADRPPRIVLIGHEECRWYKHLFPVARQTPVDHITGDLRRAREALVGRFPNVHVDLYYARTNPQGHLSFDAL